MDAIVGAAATSCPAAFGGMSGGIFLQAVTSLVATHCALSEYYWPPDRSDEIVAKSAGGVSYDFIVVGAGTAGSLVASKLSNKYPHFRVLLIEAGDDPSIDSDIPGLFFLNQHSNNDWNYETESDGRTCLGFKDNRCIWSKGKGMGGSGSINAMLYIRGHPKDYDAWKQVDKNDWGYADLKYYFDLQEKELNISELTKTDHTGWYHVMDEAWKQLGFISHKYNNNEGHIGTKKCTILVKNGKRLNTARVVLEKSKNLHIMKNTIVQSVILDKKSKRAMGVKVKLSSGSALEIQAKKEVILSSGSIATPQLLMLSGIGPRKHLEDKGIECFLDLPVGKNLQDHLVFPLMLKTKQHATLTSEMMNFFLLEYMLLRSGPIASIGLTDFFGFINTKNSSDRPNIQFHHIYNPKKDAFTLPMILKMLGYKHEIEKDIMALNEKQDILALYPTLLHPKSRGEVLLRDTDWKSKPIIRTNYLQHPDDMVTMLEAIEFVQKLEKTEAFKMMGLELLKVNIPGCSTLEFDSKTYWSCYVYHLGCTIYHPVGTVKMGNDDSSVVDYNLLVHGIENLRVVDASIMPTIPGSNTMAATLAIAYKAVDIITNTYKLKDEL